jgi:hypothetical protein
MFTTSIYCPEDDGCDVHNHLEDTATDDKFTADILDGQVHPELLPDVHPSEIRLLFAGEIGI